MLSVAVLPLVAGCGSQTVGQQPANSNVQRMSLAGATNAAGADPRSVPPLPPITPPARTTPPAPETPAGSAATPTGSPPGTATSPGTPSPATTSPTR